LGAVAAVCIENAVNRARLLRAGITDFLTGWHNRRYLQQRLKEELARAQRRGGTIGCLMIDIDRFKGINDGYGHLAGDNALKEIAHRVESQIRSMDTAARFGGDELAILLPEATAAEAAKLAERIREVIAATPFPLTAEIERTLTVSVGVAAVSPGRHETDLKAVADRLLADADAALYRAKALGRNRVQVGAG
jgi:diguanylate cyclase (GGDEF)-like protein